MSWIVAKRLFSTPLSSVALWSGPGLLLPLYCLEPGEGREPHPRIPAGEYRFALRQFGQKHEAYKEYYDQHAKFGVGWHRGMIEICGVPGREAIEFHIGNFIKDTQGCSVCGHSWAKGADGEFQVHESRAAYEANYPALRDHILAGPTTVSILDTVAMA